MGGNHSIAWLAPDFDILTNTMRALSNPDPLSLTLIPHLINPNFPKQRFQSQPSGYPEPTLHPHSLLAPGTSRRRLFRSLWRLSLTLRSPALSWSLKGSKGRACGWLTIPMSRQARRRHRARAEADIAYLGIWSAAVLTSGSCGEHVNVLLKRRDGEKRDRMGDRDVVVMGGASCRAGALWSV